MSFIYFLSKLLI